jgi:hypothetical protein
MLYFHVAYFQRFEKARLNHDQRFLDVRLEYSRIFTSCIKEVLSAGNLGVQESTISTAWTEDFILLGIAAQ